MKLITIIAAIFVSSFAHAQQVNQSIINGNDYYRKGEYENAEKEYSAALKSEPENNVAQMNLANTVYRKGNADQAKKSYTKIAGDEIKPELKGQAYYNRGAVLSKEKKLEESIEAYKAALKQNPTDTEARENLQKALLELKKKDPPKPKDQDQKKKKQDQKQQQKPQPKMSQKEAEQRLKLMDQKEKEVQQRLQKEKAKTGGSQQKDW
jgi:Ca-activated chloride channel family protein